MKTRPAIFLLAACLIAATAWGQIPKPDDAPQPLAPSDAVQSFKLPPGLRIELVASEPLIHEPSGVCWDEQGRLFVCELHGYNLDGQIDVDELNKTGKLDKVVRRFFVPEHIEKAAEAGTFGTVKRLIDTNGDGLMDKSEVWADRLPACFGICPARGGIIVVAAPDIIYLADRDGDGKAEVREVLFTGFPTGVLDRRMGTPQWGLDDWIYVGRAHAEATITGPHLVAESLRDLDSASRSTTKSASRSAATVKLPNSDFRIKPDGSAIEPISGAVSGLGHTFTESGDRFISSVGWPAHFVVPLPWQSLARNSYVASPPLTTQVFPDRRVYPTSKAHPWRSRRAEDPGFSKFYTDGWGIAESAPNGYFTSCCGPLVYQDNVLPGLRGQLLACEPAQNLIHRSVITRDGLRLMLSRARGEEASEFLTSTDSWFHPIAMTHGPDGCVWITDFYREIIEDYSAIPRYLQQQYGVTNGKDRGRIWRLAVDRSHARQSVGASPDAHGLATVATGATMHDMSRLSAADLANEVGSTLFWRRQTARRLLTERKQTDAAPRLIALAREAKESATVINALHTLDALGELKPELLESLLTHTDSGVRRQVMQLAERRLPEQPDLLTAALRLADDSEAIVRLQLALSLGASRDPRVLPLLAKLARQYGDDPWMATAILSTLAGRGGEMLVDLLRPEPELKQAQRLLEPLCAAIAALRQEQELGAALVTIATVEDQAVQLACLRGIRSSFGSASAISLGEEARQSVKKLRTSDNADIRSLAQLLVRLMKLESPADRVARLAQARLRLHDVALNADMRLVAITELGDEDDASIAPTLIAELASATPRLHEAILNAVFSRQDRIPALLDGLEQKSVAPTALSAVQRSLLLENKDDAIRTRAGQLLTTAKSASLELFPVYAAALKERRDVARGQQIFREICGQCHQAHGLGVSVAIGPDLSSEFQRAEETIIRDILAPSDVISPGYMTYVVATKSGQIFTGLLASESPTSIALKQMPQSPLTLNPQQPADDAPKPAPVNGRVHAILRNTIDEIRVSPISLMPEDLVKRLKPQDVADVIAWIRQPQDRVVLLDDNQALATALNEGTGTAEFITSDKFSGESSLRITPPQRFSPRIKGWEFRIREKPIVGEYRYIRFAWKSPQASGVMLEFADDGQWPPADQTLRRYFAGKNLTGWQAVGIAPRPPADWTVMTRDLWQDFGDFTLTGIAPTAIAGPALFDRIELMRALDAPADTSP